MRTPFEAQSNSNYICILLLIEEIIDQLEGWNDTVHLIHFVAVVNYENRTLVVKCTHYIFTLISKTGY